MTLSERVKDMVRNWLQIQPAQDSSIAIREPVSFEGEVARNRIWYRGDASELDQLFKQLQSDAVGRARFWAAAPETEQIRKIHSGIPGMMANTLAHVVKADMGDVVFDSEKGQDSWAQIVEELDFTKLVGDAVVDTLVTGDGAFKISLDTEVSSYPLVEFWAADSVRYVTRHGRITAVQFLSTHYNGKASFRLCEEYSKGAVTYRLFDKDKEVPLDTVPALAGLHPVVHDSTYMLAVPFRVYDNAKHTGRGRSIFEGKTEVFDAHDEVISQWLDAVRAGRVQKYIPEDLLPRSKTDGSPLSVNSFGTNFVQISKVLGEDAKTGQIQVVQPEIRYDAYLATYCSTLDMCLQGIMSPATLGIDVGKMSSADAQREKKDITGHTRNAITAALEKVLPELIKAILKAYDQMNDHAPGEYAPSISFGEYGSPDFGSRVDNICKAATSNIMSVEAQVEELWGTSKPQKWMDAEVLRIKAEKGLVTALEPSPGGELIDME